MDIIEFAKYKKMAGGAGETVEEYEGAVEIAYNQGKEQTNGN